MSENEYNPQSVIIKEIHSEIHGKVKRLERIAYHTGINEALQFVYDAIDWFRSKYGSEYILYDANSMKHLLELYQEEGEENVDTDTAEERDN